MSQVVKVDSYGRLLHEIDVLDSDLEVFDVDLVWIRLSIFLKPVNAVSLVWFITLGKYNLLQAKLVASS